MVRNKHEYRIAMGRGQGEQRHVYEYSYGSTRGIHLCVADDFAEIIVHMAPFYDVHELFTEGSPLFSDAVKKACILHLLWCSRQLPLDSARIYVDEAEAYSWPDAVLCSLLTGPELLRSVPPDSITDAAVARILDTKPSRQGCLDAALHAYLYAKSKALEADRLIYLWMSINGLYSTVSQLVQKRIGSGRCRKEYKKIERLVRAYNLGNSFHDSGQSPYRGLVDKVACIVREMPDGVKRSDLEEGQFADQVHDVITHTAPELDITPYGYVLLALSYHYRCSLFHGSKPLPLYAHESEHSLRCLRACNDLLEEFLDENLLLWFDESRRDNLFSDVLDRVACQSG